MSASDERTPPLFPDLPAAEPSAESAGVPAGVPRLRTAERQQVVWEPRALDELLPAEHRARMVWAFVQRLDLSAWLGAIKAVVGQAGQPATDPRLLLAVWLYATSEGLGAARAVARRCESDLAYRWILGGVTVNYHTLSDFRRQHEAALDALLTESLAVLMAEGLLELERVAQDGLRVRASAGAASFRRAPTLREHLAAAREQVQRLKRELDGDERTPRQRAAQERAARERQARIERALEQLPQVQAVKRSADERDRARVSTTDPEARVMKMADGGYRPAYNVQFGTETAGQFVVAVEVGNCGSDMGQLPPVLEQVGRRCGQVPAAWLVDGGFTAVASIEQADTCGVLVYGPVQQPRDPGRDPHRPRPGDSAAVAAWRVRMGTDAAKEVYKERAATAECVNALARLRGLGRFWVRGLRAVRCVALLVALTHNLLRRDSLLQARAAAAGG